MTDDEKLIEQVARALAQSHGLDFDEVCGVDADPVNGECDSGTCVASSYEDHDAAYARAMYRADARAILPIIKAERIRGGEMVKEAAAITAFGSLNVVDAGDRIRALSVPAIVEAGEHQPKENTDASSD